MFGKVFKAQSEGLNSIVFFQEGTLTVVITISPDNLTIKFIEDGQ